VKGLGSVEQVVAGGAVQNQQPVVPVPQPQRSHPMNWQEELGQLLQTLDAVEDRVQVIRKNLKLVANTEGSMLD